MTVWSRQMEDGSVAVALYNEDDKAIEASVDFSTLGNEWTSTTAATVRDIWEFKDLGTFNGKYPKTGTVSVAPHAAIVLRMKKTSMEGSATTTCKDANGKKDEPCLPGSNACCDGPSGVGQSCFNSATQDCCTTGAGKGHVCPKDKCSTRAGFICD